MTYINEAVGTTVAWPADKVIMDSSPRLKKKAERQCYQTCGGSKTITKTPPQPQDCKMLAYWNKSTTTPRLEAQLDFLLFGYAYADVEKEMVSA
ncbi:hypothetical protein RHGRI_029387 [Rhododendron griersonianum]|uniref:Transposase Tnp1/En/Spm-like domain-containing protein n=1 Tax=Rhododendron griersonianum TaxID=479676 RepID=A0AAV6ILE7_9ERIC|nr:hypothetical protein RHGRI_029387 [Rhododendron griersonianum]